MANLETQLRNSIDAIKAEIAEKQNELKEAEQNLKDYTNNRTVIEKILALQAGKKPRKPRTPKIK